MSKVGGQNMNIDEAIEHCLENSMKELINGNTLCANEHCQLAQWLLELKTLRSGMFAVCPYCWGETHYRDKGIIKCKDCQRKFSSDGKRYQ